MQHSVDASCGGNVKYQQTQPPLERITFPSGGGYVMVRQETTTTTSSAQPPAMEQRVFMTGGESRTALESEALRAFHLNKNDSSGQPADYAPFSPQQQQQQRYQSGQPQYSTNNVRDGTELWQSGAQSPPQNAHYHPYQDQRNEAQPLFFSSPPRQSRSLSPTQLKEQQKLTENYYLKRYYEPTWVDLVNDVQSQGGIIEVNSQPPSQQTIFLSGPPDNNQQQQHRQTVNHQPHYNNQVDELSQKQAERTFKQSSHVIRERIVENPSNNEYQAQTTWNQQQPNQQQIIHRQFVNQPSQQQFVSQPTPQQHNVPPTQQQRYEIQQQQKHQQQGHLSQPTNEQNSYVIYQREVARPAPITTQTTQYYILDQQVPPLQYDQQQQKQQYVVLQNQVSPQQKYQQPVEERQLHEEVLQQPDGQRYILLRNPDQQVLSPQQKFVQQAYERPLSLQQHQQQQFEPQQQAGQEYKILRNQTHVLSPQQKVVNQQVQQKPVLQQQTQNVVRQLQQSNEIQPQHQQQLQQVVQQPIHQDKQQVNLQGRGQQQTIVQQSRQQQQFLQKQQAQAVMSQQQTQQIRFLQKQPVQQQHFVEQTLRQQTQPITENYNQQYQMVQRREQQQLAMQPSNQLLITVSQQQQSEHQIADQPANEPQEQRAPFENQQQPQPGQVKVVSQHTAKEEFYPRREPNNPFQINNNDYFYVKQRNFESGQSANFSNNSDVVAIPSGPPPTFTTNFGVEQGDAVPYRKLAPRSKSANHRSYQSPMNTFSCGGMDFIDHNNPVPSEFENIIIESGTSRRSRRDDLPLRRPGDHFGLDFSTHPAAADANNIVISEDYRGYAPLQPRQHWKFSADPEAPVLNNFEVEVIDDGTPHLIGDTLSNQKVSYDRPLTEEEKRTFGTAFAPPAGFKPEHRTFISPPKDPEPTCYSISVKKEKALSPQQNQLPTSTPESFGQEQYKQKGMSGNSIVTNNNTSNVVSGKQERQGQQQQQSWYVDGNREIMKAEPNWSKNVNLRTRAWEMESVNQNRPTIVKRPAWVKSGGRASSVSAPQTTYDQHNSRQHQSYYPQRDQQEEIAPNNHQQQQQWQQHRADLNNNNYTQDDSNENFI